MVTPGRLLIGVVAFAVVLVLTAVMLSSQKDGLSEPGAVAAPEGNRAECVRLWNEALPDRPAVGSAVYVTASGDAYCDMEFVEPDGDVGVWQHTSTTGWTWLAPTDGSPPVLLAPEESHVEGLDVDEAGNLVGLVPTDG
jgi:hypothetical protein